MDVRQASLNAPSALSISLIGFLAIVEQATHLISLSLAFGGKPRLESVFTHTVEHHEKPGKLSVLSFDENTIPEDSRVPRYTNSIWKYENGAVGSVVHVIGLHKNTYDTVVWLLPFFHLHRQK